MRAPSHFPIVPVCLKGLPICDSWDELKHAIKKHQVIIVTGETGSGKTTQLPKICLAAGRGRKKQIACTQPRRIAAISMARRVASELGAWGQRHVGYRIRFSSSAGRDTVIKFITDGMLLAEMQRDRLLRAYDTIIVDEAHERSLNIDFILGALRRLLPSRKDLKVIITSATMDTEKFVQAFPGSAEFHIGGRGYPVDVIYAPPEKDDKGREPCTVDSTVEAVRKILDADRQGDILVFLPTENDIIETARILRGGIEARSHGNKGQSIDILPVYGRLSASEQQRIFHQTGRIKVVIATNIAETSITVPGITWVVDSGLARIATYSVSSRTKALPVVPISKASAMQRAGRAGRVKPGVCIRLYSQDDFEKRREFTPPEILRSNLAEVILRLASMGLGNAEEFPFVDPPSRQAVKEGMTTLREIGAIDLQGRITRMGRVMARLPIDPRLARIILQARRENCLHEAMTVAAALSIQDPRERPSEKIREADAAHAIFRDAESDFITLLNIWQAFHRIEASGGSRNSMRRFCRRHFLSWNRMREWRDIFKQFATILKDGGIIDSRQKETLDRLHMPWEYISKERRERLHRSILAGFLSHAAIRNETGQYIATRGREIHIFPGSSLFKSAPECIMAVELVRTSRLFARTAAVIKPEWLEELGGNFCKIHRGEPYWSRKRGEVVVKERVTLWGLTVAESRITSFRKIDAQKARLIFITNGLAQGELKKQYGFLRHNTRLLDKFMEMEQRTRQRGIMADETVLVDFYITAVSRLENKTGKTICDETSLARAIRVAGSDRLLRMDERFIKNHCMEPEQISDYPGTLTVSGHAIHLSYRFQPGDPFDGVTAEIPVRILEDMRSEDFDWLVPGLLPEKIEAMLKKLPKQVRKRLVPIPATTKQVIPLLDRNTPDLTGSLGAILAKLHNVQIEKGMWPAADELPAHLRMHYRIIDDRGRTIKTGDNLAEIKSDLQGKRQPAALDLSLPEIKKVRSKWERKNITAENFPDIPPIIKVTISSRPKRHMKKDPARKHAKSPKEITLFPALACVEQRVDLVLAGSRQEAQRLTQEGVTELVTGALDTQFRYIKKMCDNLRMQETLDVAGQAEKGNRAVKRHSSTTNLLSITLNIKNFNYNLWNMVRRELVGTWQAVPSSKTLQEFLKNSAPVLVSRAQEIINLVESALKHALPAGRAIHELRHGRFTGPVTIAIAHRLATDLSSLFPHHFPVSLSPLELERYPVYLKAIITMAQRAAAAPGKQQSKIAALEPVYDILTRLDSLLDSLYEGENSSGPDTETAIHELRIMCREFIVSVYAQELGAARGVSLKKIKALWENLSVLLNKPRA